MLAEIRSFGQGIIIADQIPTKLAADTIKNTNLKIVHRTVMEDDRQCMGAAMHMTEKQTDTRDVVLEIVGTQRLNGDSDKIELTTVGTLQTEPETLVFRYTEQQEPPEEPIYVQVRLRRDQTEAEILRPGAYGSCLTIARGQRNLCRYGTPYGDVLMGIYGKAVEIQENAADGRVQLRYEIDINGTLASKNQLKIDYRITGSQGE